MGNFYLAAGACARIAGILYIPERREGWYYKSLTIFLVILTVNS